MAVQGAYPSLPDAPPKAAELFEDQIDSSGNRGMGAEFPPGGNTPSLPWPTLPAQTAISMNFLRIRLLDTSHPYFYPRSHIRSRPEEGTNRLRQPMKNIKSRALYFAVTVSLLITACVDLPSPPTTIFPVPPVHPLPPPAGPEKLLPPSPPPAESKPAEPAPKRTGIWVGPIPAPPRRSAPELLAELRKAPSGPNADEALFALATHDIRKNRFNKAIENFRSLMDRFPLSPHYNESEFLLGLSLQAVRNSEEAWLPLRGSLSREAQPLRRASLQAALGEVYENKKNPFAALISYAEALSNGPDLAIAPQVRGRLTSLAHSGVKIHQLLIAADRFRQKPAGPLLRLAFARRSVGNNRLEASRAALRRFLRDYPDHPATQEAKALLHNLSERLNVNRGRVGVILPLSGPSAPAGVRVYQGIQLALRPSFGRSTFFFFFFFFFFSNIP